MARSASALAPACTPSARLARRLQVGLEADALALERAHEGRCERRGTPLDQRLHALDGRGVDEGVERVRAETGLELALELLPQSGLDVGAQLGDRLELRDGARELVVGGGQHLLLDLLDRHVDGALPAVGQLELDGLRLALAPSRAAPPRARRRAGRCRARPCSRGGWPAACPAPWRRGRARPCRRRRPDVRSRARALRRCRGAARARPRRARPAPRARARAPRASSSRRASASARPEPWPGR